MSMQRRHLLGLVALAAAAAGAGVAWRHRGPMLSEAEQAFWAARFTDPEGRALDLASFRGHPVLVNFWATWCPPCVEELPMLNGFHTAHGPKGWRVLGLAVDQPRAVQAFMGRLPLNFPVGMAGFSGVELSRALGNPNGGLPFSVVFDRSGVVLHRKVGKVSEADLAAWAQTS
ncbi:redoxin [Hydrogenophaga crassostreae]|uniref:Redoxin n=1 Tax=Hydrogenophaga crassostreae TaxID=1763535 RepID=A0A167HMN2_9BURK|nr:TlpA disulfide reductase family protein [Hydrogenophaga crassostreae]AOW14895.1 redoxin [Hydrogenophaga crassostreae]OAD41461.1 redoxin [Hydrogenophaga crassostreae]